MMSSTTVAKHIASQPARVQKLLRELRQIIRSTAPLATETISYGIPTYQLHGNLVHFAGYKEHIGFYPGSAALVEFKKDLTKYKTSKGTVQFPLNEPLPTGLIKRIVRYRVRQNISKHKLKTK